MRAEKANSRRADPARPGAAASSADQELTIPNEITRLALNVDNTYKQFQAARKAREVAERNVDAEQTRFDIGLSTNFTVATVQETLTSQRLSRAQRDHPLHQRRRRLRARPEVPRLVTADRRRFA